MRECLFLIEKDLEAYFKEKQCKNLNQFEQIFDQMVKMFQKNNLLKLIEEFSTPNTTERIKILGFALMYFISKKHLESLVNSMGKLYGCQNFQ